MFLFVLFLSTFEFDLKDKWIENIRSEHNQIEECNTDGKQTHNKTETGFPAPEGKEWYWFYGKLRLRDKSDHMMEPEEEDGEVNGEEGWEEEEWWQEEGEQEDEKMYD